MALLYMKIINSSINVEESMNPSSGKKILLQMYFLQRRQT